MKYFIDTEFLEGTQDKTIFGIKYSKTKPTIDLISIGIVCEDGREYYAISKDFNLKEAWNRYDIKSMSGKGGIGENTHDKDYWIRENVLKPIWNELVDKFALEEYKANTISCTVGYNPPIKFSYKNFKKLIKKYGKTNKQIAEEIVQFIDARWIEEENISKGFMYPGETSIKEVKTKNVQFYGYYSDYDWVVFCWLFGKMIDLPKGFPMYCIDLKQTLDEKIKKSWKDVEMSTWGHNGIENITKLPNYPKQINEHNALADAKWNFELYKFLEQL